MNSIGTNTIPLPPPVTTALASSVIARVPYDNVAPSVSSAHIDQNASGNHNSYIPSQATSETVSEPVTVIPAVDNTPSPAAQAAFLAQLLGQDNSPVAQVILVQYEKLVALSNVKYKPSNAFKPPPADPSSQFGQLLKHEDSLPVEQQQAQKPPAPRAAPSFSVPAPVATPVDTVTAAYTASIARQKDARVPVSESA